MKKLLPAVLVLALASSAAAECEVVEASDAIVGGERLEIGDRLAENDHVEIEDGGEVVALCGSTLVETSQTGSLSEAETVEEIDPDLKGDFTGAVFDESEAEENLDEINELMDEEVPDRVQSIILGDNVNVKIGDTVVGLESEESEITGVEEGGVRDPDLEISIEEGTVEEVMNSDNTMEAIRESYGEEIQVEAKSLRYRALFGLYDALSTARDLVSGLI